MPALIAGKQALVESLRAKYADVADSYGWPSAAATPVRAP